MGFPYGEARRLVSRRAGQAALEVGAFQGAHYDARALYRWEIDCIMFSRTPAGFCAVCRRALSSVIDLFTRRRDD